MFESFLSSMIALVFYDNSRSPITISYFDQSKSCGVPTQVNI